jgi:RNA polymerase sigma-70 factor (ECF subfamily)
MAQDRSAATSRFQTTQWSVVIAAGAPAATPAAREALAVLCATYWSPLYAFVRRRGFRVEEAEDLTQAFFTKLLEETETFRRADPSRGKFRAFLLGALRHFLSDESDRARTLKRGGSSGGDRPVRLDIDATEVRLSDAALDARSPEWHFDREWALTVLRLSLNALWERYARDGKDGLFVALQPHLAGDGLALSHAQVAAQLDMTEEAVKVALHRLRKRYGEAIRREIARTLGSSAGVDEELRHLREILRS